jgi:hypothetical protein
MAFGDLSVKNVSELHRLQIRAQCLTGVQVLVPNIPDFVLLVK